MLPRIRKAITAAVGAGLAALVQALANGNDGVTAQEVGVIVGAMVVVGYATFKVPNKPEPPTV